MIKQTSARPTDAKSQKGFRALMAGILSIARRGGSRRSASWKPALRVFALALPLLALSQDAFAIGQTQYVTMAKARGRFRIVEGKDIARVYVDAESLAGSVLSVNGLN